MRDTVFRHATVVDGTGRPPFNADVLVHQNRIVDVGSFQPPAEALSIDCTGLTLSPGFIDGHSHLDLHVLRHREEKLAQGVTSDVVGNCGFSVFPCGPQPERLREYANGLLCGDWAWGWESAEAYFSEIERCCPLAYIASYAGHGSLRVAHAGHRLGRLPEEVLRAMECSLDEALNQGACGFSTGLMYAPGESAPPEELERLCRVVARHGKLHASHIRTYFSGLVAAVDEQIELARRTGCRLQISHLQAVGRKNWALQQTALEHIEQARAEGIDVEFDCYPYVAGSSVLTQLLPQPALEGGTGALLRRLADASERRRLAAATEASIEWQWGDVYISSVESQANRKWIGKSLLEIAEATDREPVDVLLDLLAEERCAATMLSFNQSEENLRQTLTLPLSIVISDGFFVRGRPHPRLRGAFPFLLGTISRERRWMSLPEAIHKITDRPARRFGIADRGRIALGYLADLTLFDAATVGSPATYEEPEKPPKGILAS